MVQEGLHAVAPILPSAVIVLLVVLVLLAARKLLWRTAGVPSEHQFRNEVIMLFLTALGALIVLLVLPMRDATRAQLLNLSGIVLSAGIALASTTFIGNAFAAMMLRAVGNFRAGDFIRVADHFGRVTERALFHTEIRALSGPTHSS